MAERIRAIKSGKEGVLVKIVEKGGKTMYAVKYDGNNATYYLNEDNIEIILTPDGPAIKSDDDFSPLPTEKIEISEEGRLKLLDVDEVVRSVIAQTGIGNLYVYNPTGNGIDHPVVIVDNGRQRIIGGVTEKNDLYIARDIDGQERTFGVLCDALVFIVNSFKESSFDYLVRATDAHVK